MRACPRPPSPVSVLSRYRVPRARSVGRWKETLTGLCALGPGALELGEGATFLLGEGATFLSVGSGFLAAAAPPFAPPALAAALGGPDALMMAKRPSSLAVSSLRAHARVRVGQGRATATLHSTSIIAGDEIGRLSRHTPCDFAAVALDQLHTLLALHRV